MSLVTMPMAASAGTAQAYLEIEQDAQSLGNTMHRRLSDLPTSNAEALLGDGANLIAEHIARAA
jgi:hypothetical protein